MNGLVSFEWTLDVDFTFPVEQMVAIIHLQQKVKEHNAKAYNEFLRRSEKFVGVGPGVVVDLPLMGNLEVEVFSCSNVAEIKSSDTYRVRASAFRHNEVYEAADIDDRGYLAA